MSRRFKGSRITVDGHHPLHGGASLIAWLLGQGAHVTVAGATQSEATVALQRRVDQHLKRSAKDGVAYDDACARLSWTARRSADVADALNVFVDAWPRRAIGITGATGKTTSVLWASHLIGDAVAVGYAPDRPYVAAFASRAKTAIAEVHGAAPVRGDGLSLLSTDDAQQRVNDEPILSRINLDGFVALWGRHNVSNVVTAVGAARLAGVPASVIVRRISSLPQAPYRQEVVLRDARLTVVNDAAATTPIAGVAALARWGGPTTVLIAGGHGEPADYGVWARELCEEVRRTNVRLLVGEATRSMRSALRRVGYTAPAFDTLSEAWHAACARANTYVSATIVFSPATTGDIHERGQLFNTLVAARTR